MFWTYCKRGVAAGAIAGIGYGIVLALVGNPLTEYMEGLAHHGDGHGHDHAHTVSETTTALVSVGSGVLWGIFLGVVFAASYYLFEPRLPGTGSMKPYVLAGAGFLTVSAMPWLVLPPAAPGMEQRLGTTPRLALYGGLMIVGAILSAVSVGLYNRCSPRRAVGAAVATLPILVTVVGLSVGAPTVTTSAGLAGELVAAYQGFVVLGQAGLWLALASSYSWLTRTDRLGPPAYTEHAQGLDT